MICRGFRSGAQTACRCRVLCSLVASGWLHVRSLFCLLLGRRPTMTPSWSDTAAAQLGGKANAARLAAIVEAELARQDGDGGGGGGGDSDSGAGVQGKKATTGRQPNRLTQALSAAADTVSHSQMQHLKQTCAGLGSREDLKQTCAGWCRSSPVSTAFCATGNTGLLSVGRKDPRFLFRFLTPLFAGHDAVLPAFLTRAQVIREGDAFGMN